MKSLDDLEAHYSDLKQLCLRSDEPIFLKDKREGVSQKVGRQGLKVLFIGHLLC